MSNAFKLGREGESIAEKYLITQNFIILEKNWYYKKAEIDIIASSKKKLHIIEVKSRTSFMLSPESAINKKKKRLLIDAANQYVIINNIEKEVQFDIISLIKERSKWNISYIPDAFNSIDI